MKNWKKNRVRSYARFTPDDIINLAHEEYIEDCVLRLKENLSQIFEREDKIELNELTLLGMDKVSAYIALLFLSAESDYDLVQEEFYSDLYVVRGEHGTVESQDDENGYILQVKEEHMDIVEKLCPVELKPAVLRTLSVIALKEPIRQTDLKELRGSTAYEHVQELLDKGLISRTKDKNGRSYNLKTTPKFSEYFKLKGDTRSLAKLLEVDKGIKENV